MADDENVDRSEWLVAPPEAGEVRLMVELGEGAELTPEAAASLEQLLSDLQDAEVEGFAMGPRINVGMFGGGASSFMLKSTCNKLTCNKHNCAGTFVCDIYNSEGRSFR